MLDFKVADGTKVEESKKDGGSMSPAKKNLVQKKSQTINPGGSPVGKDKGDKSVYNK